MIRSISGLNFLFLIVCSAGLSHVSAQQPRPAASAAFTSGGLSPGASPSPTANASFSPQTLTDLERLQQAALASDYAYRQVAHLSNNIGPRLSGSIQAAKAVEYVAAELKAIGCEVQLEKVMVPHWVRGEETGALVQYPGQAENTVQKVVLCALGASVATPPEGLTGEVIVRNRGGHEIVGDDGRGHRGWNIRRTQGAESGQGCRQDCSFQLSIR